MVEVEPWAAERAEMLSLLSPQPVGEKDATFDRLADILRALSRDEGWEAIERRLGQQVIRVYNLRQEPTRVDSTTVALYHNADETTLFRLGHSKDHRPDPAQFKVMLAALDPLVAAGNAADDPLYEPVIRQARQVVGQGGRLYIGDSKMAALRTRAFLQAAGDYYLTPLPRTGQVPQLLSQLLEPVWEKEQALEPIYSAPQGDPSRKLWFLAYETTRSQQGEWEGQQLTWPERVLVVFSPTLAK